MNHQPHIVMEEKVPDHRIQALIPDYETKLFVLTCLLLNVSALFTISQSEIT